MPRLFQPLAALASPCETALRCQFPKLSRECRPCCAPPCSTVLYCAVLGPRWSACVRNTLACIIRARVGISIDITEMYRNLEIPHQHRHVGPVYRHVDITEHPTASTVFLPHSSYLVLPLPTFRRHSPVQPPCHEPDLHDKKFIAHVSWLTPSAGLWVADCGSWIMDHH